MGNRLVGDVYCISEVDQFGKISHKFVPIKDINFSDNKSLEVVINEQKKEIQELKARTKNLESILALVVKSCLVGGEKNV